MKDKSYYYTPEYLMQFLKMHKPFNTSKSNTSDGEVVSYAEFGNPNGEVFLYLHGGPGGNCQPLDLAFFNLEKHRVILWDQRHCGNSKSNESWKVNNTTSLLLRDIEQIRKELKIEEWNLFGGSWGTCLGLNYAINYPQRVKKQVYWGILLGRQACTTFIAPEMLTPMEKFYCDNGFFIPENFILDNADKIKDHEIYIVHGETDNICSVENARELHSRLKNSKLFVAINEDHNPFMPEMLKSIKKIMKDI